MRTTLLLASLAGLLLADEPYQKPPREIVDVLNAPSTPRAIVSPTRTHVLFAEPMRYPPIAVVAAPMLRLAGLRINPRNNGPHRGTLDTSLVLTRIDDGSAVKIQLPPGAKISSPRWSPDGKQFAFTNHTETAIELWIGETANGQVRKIQGVRVNAALTLPGGGFRRQRDGVMQWMPDSRRLVVQTVPVDRGAPPTEASIPTGPHTQESFGHTGPIRTYEDMLSNAHDEDLFDYYATAQLAIVDTASGRVEPKGKPGIFLTADPAPDGQHLLVARVHKPYSYLHPVFDFPKDVEVWNSAGNMVYRVASLPMADRVPIEGVATGPRNYEWQPNEPATLYWVEALDGGNPKEKVPHRDRIVALKAPFTGTPQEIFKTEQRFRGLEFADKNSIAFVEDYERNRRWQRMFVIHADQPGGAPKLLWELNSQDRYHSRGTPLTRTLPTGRAVVRLEGDNIFLTGAGASPEGDRPFLDRMNLDTGKTERLFRAGADRYEDFVALLDDTGTKILTQRESQTSPPNYFVRTLGANASERALTHYTDPTPQLKGITKQLVTYKRQDGVPLSFTLYLPPGYKQGTRLPTVVWAYPLEYNDADTAGQISGSVQKFTSITGPSHLFFLLRGYAILDNAAMPVIGNPETVNNTYLEQIVMDAKAAIDKAVEMGVTDRERVGVGGHSYGAFMTANLLSHSNLFRAGIARSGAYNRTLTPFGFQTERRTIWEAEDVYLRMSPFLHADKIKAPILLIHGEADDNTGTFPIQSERMYQAIRGNGGTVRLVTLPAEAHGYQARETIEHVLYEMIGWFDKYVKGAEPRVSTE
jgi:dipeptidyl aminopeptidase/acylaminoacyl peptidase